MKKKKLFDTTVGKILKGVVSVVSPTLGNVLGNVNTVEDAVEAIRSAKEIDNETKIKLEQLLLDHESEITKRWLSDNQYGSFLSRNVRPLLALITGCLVLYGWLNDADVNAITPVAITVLGGYFTVRTIDKMKIK